MAILTLEEINTNCAIVAEPHPFYDQIIEDFFRVLYFYGCRPVELMNISRWTYLDVSNITLQPAKGNNIRTLSTDNLPPNFINAIQNQREYFSIYSLAKYDYIFKKFSTYSRMEVYSKIITSYSYRYRLVKTMYSDGFTKVFIKEYFGWTNTAMVDVYINADVEGFQ